MDGNNVINIFTTKLSDYIKILETKLEDYENVYSAHSYLINNYRHQSNSIVGALSSISIDKIYELLVILEKNPLYSKGDIDNALKFCKACEINPKFKEHERYKELYKILENIHNIFITHVFRKRGEFNQNYVIDARLRCKKFKDLELFINGELSEYELESLESYHFDHANLSDEEWIQIYLYLTTLQIENYKRKEDTLREDINIREEQRRAAMTEALEKKIRDSLSKKDREVLQALDNLDNIEELEVEEELNAEPVVVPSGEFDNGKSLLSNEEVKRLYELLQEKYRLYKSYGKITPSKKDIFKLSYDVSDPSSSLEYAKIAYNTSDYQKFLFFCFYEKYADILTDVNGTYNEDFNAYVEVIIDDMNQALDYILRLEKELELENNELENATEDETFVQEQKLEKTYKLVFYENDGSTSEIEKSLKNMTPEKISDLANVLRRLEEGRLENVKNLRKHKKVGFKMLVGQFVFLTFRTLPNNHILVYTAGTFDELNNNKVDNRLAVFDTNLERKINLAIKDQTLEYRKLMKKSEDIKALIFAQELNKGV